MIGQSLPARPAELRLDGVDPCTLLSAARRAKLGTSTGVSGANTDEFGSTGCVWSGTSPGPDSSWIPKAITGHGAEYALNSVTGAQVVAVSGFPAVQTTSNFVDPAHECLVFVYVAAGQSLSVEYVNRRGDYPGISHELACQLVTTAATAMVTTLRTGAR